MNTIMTIITLYANNCNNSDNDNNYHYHDYRMFSVLTRGHNKTDWNLCQFVLMLRTGAKPRHTKQNQA